MFFTITNSSQCSDCVCVCEYFLHIEILTRPLQCVWYSLVSLLLWSSLSPFHFLRLEKLDILYGRRSHDQGCWGLSTLLLNMLLKHMYFPQVSVGVRLDLDCFSCNVLWRWLALQEVPVLSMLAVTNGHDREPFSS